MRTKIASKYLSRYPDSGNYSQIENPTTSPKYSDKADDVNPFQKLRHYDAASSQYLVTETVDDSKRPNINFQQENKFNYPSSFQGFKQFDDKFQNLNAGTINGRGNQTAITKIKNQVDDINPYEEFGKWNNKLQTGDATFLSKKSKRKVAPKKKRVFKICSPDEALTRSNEVLKKLNADIRSQKQKQRTSIQKEKSLSDINSDQELMHGEANLRKLNPYTFSEIKVQKASFRTSNEIKDPSPDLELRNSNTKLKKSNASLDLLNQKQKSKFNKRNGKESDFVSSSQEWKQYHIKMPNLIEKRAVKEIIFPFIYKNTSYSSKQINSDNSKNPSLQNLSFSTSKVTMSIQMDEDEELRRAKEIVKNWMAEEYRSRVYRNLN